MAANVTLGSSGDGQVSWSQFVSSFRRTAEEQLDMLPAVGLFVLVVVMVVINWQIAKRVLSLSSRGSKRGHEPSALVEDDGAAGGEDERPRRAA